MKTINKLLFVILSISLSNNLYSQQFTKVTSGIFVTETGASRSVNFIDYNGDGRLDIYVTHGLQGGQNNCLYRNDGNGIFTKITGLPITQTGRPSDGSSWADFKNDGNLDLCFANWYGFGENLYLNTGNSVFIYLDTSIISTRGGYSETCSWGDYNNDGLVDLFVTNSAGSGHKNYLYKNMGNGYFVKVDTGIEVSETGTSRGVNWIDVDGDGKLDLFVCNENNQNNFLYKNNGNGYFTKITSSIIANDGGNSWSGSWGDFDNDGKLDLFVANWGHQKNFLYKNEGNFNFTKITDGPLVNEIGTYCCACWGDFDNDGDLDLFVTQGYDSIPVRNRLFKNMLMETGVATFVEVFDSAIVNDLGTSYGCCCGDLNHTGFLGLYVARSWQENQNNVCYFNNGNSNKWLEIKCIGEQTNRSAIGTIVRVRAVINGNPVWQMREVTAQSSYCCENLDLHFGLGNASVIDTIRVEWFSGNRSVFTNIPVNQYLNIDEIAGIIGIRGKGTEVVKDFKLEQNYPNPFNPSTKIEYQIPKSSFVKLVIYDIMGKEVKTLVNEKQIAGIHQLDFDGSNYSSGVYFYRLTVRQAGSSTGDFTDTKKIVLLK